MPHALVKVAIEHNVIVYLDYFFNAETSGVSLSFSADLLNYGVGGMRYEVNSTRQYHILVAIYDTNTIVSLIER